MMIQHSDKGPSGFWVDDYEGCGNPKIFPEFEREQCNRISCLRKKELGQLKKRNDKNCYGREKK